MTIAQMEHCATGHGARADALMTQIAWRCNIARIIVALVNAEKILTVQMENTAVLTCASKIAYETAIVHLGNHVLCAGCASRYLADRFSHALLIHSVLKIFVHRGVRQRTSVHKASIAKTTSA